MANSQDEGSFVDKITSPEIDADDSLADSQLLTGASEINSRCVSRTDIVSLDVGGILYKVPREILMRYEGSMLASLVSGKWKERKGKKDVIFIDRDGGRFQYVLDYLRSDPVYVPDRSYQAALKDDFDYFGIDADMSKVSLLDDYMLIDELAKEIKVYEARIEQKKKKINAIHESYNLAGTFASAVENCGPYVELSFNHYIDKEILRGCLLSRGLHVVAFSSKAESGRSAAVVRLCPSGMKDKK